MKDVKLFFGLLLLLNTLNVFAQDSTAVKKLLKPGESIGAIYGGISYRLLNIDNEWKGLPMYNLRVDFWRLCLEVSGNDIRSKYPLYYSINRGDYVITDYQYKLSIIHGKLGGLIKTFRINKHLMSLWVGYALNNYVVRDIDPNYITSLGSTNDFIQIKRMAGTMLHQAFVSVDKPFWIKNQEFNIRFTGFVSVKAQPASLSQYQSGGSALFNPIFRNVIEITLSYSIIPKFQVNPFKLKPL